MYFSVCVPILIPSLSIYYIGVKMRGLLSKLIGQFNSPFKISNDAVVMCCDYDVAVKIKRHALS